MWAGYVCNVTTVLCCYFVCEALGYYNFRYVGFLLCVSVKR